MRTGSHWRGDRRAIIVMLVTVLVGGSTALPGPGHVVRAADGDPPVFRQPAEADLESDRALLLAVEIAPPPDVVDAGPAIAAADAAFESFVEDEWEIRPLVESLGLDPEAAFSFVRDSIGFDPYPGMLRGAQGTLAARAGNAYDRALLLKVLLEAQGHTARLALADLDAATAEGLVERARKPAPEPLQDASDLVLGASIRESIDRRARRDYALLRPVVDPALSGIGVPGVPDPPSVAAHHAWVQVLIDDVWVDYDPSMPDARPGQPLTPAARTYDEVLPIDRQAVTLRVVAETLQDGWLSEATVLEQRFDAADVAGRRVLLLFEPVATDGGVGLLGEVGAPTEFTPTLLVDGVPVVGAPFGVASAEGGGGFADFGGFMGDGAAGDLAGLYLDAVISVPGQPDTTSRRVLLDRVPAEARATDAVTPDVLAPMVPDENGPLVLSGIHHVMISVGGSDPRLHAYRQGQAAYFAATELATPESAEGYDADSLLWPLTVNDSSLVLASEHAIVESVSDDRARAFIGRPRVTIVSLEPDPAAPLGVSYTIDFLADRIDLLASEDATPADLARPRVWYGAMQSALETELVIRLASAFGAGRGEIDSASLRLDEAAAAPVLVSGSATSAEAPTAMRRALSAGLLVIAPDPSRADAWWTVDPTDGSTRSVIDPGLGVSKVGGTKGGGASQIKPVGGASGNMGNPAGGGGAKLPAPNPTPPKPAPMEFPDEFVPAKKPQPQGNIESQAATTEVAIPTITLLQRLKNFFRKHVGTFLTVLTVGDWIFSD